jgi:pimeloyl-ACP methyl ester carboxylesterase
MDDVTGDPVKPRPRRLFHRLMIPSGVMSLVSSLALLALMAILETWRGRLLCALFLTTGLLPTSLLFLMSRDGRRRWHAAPVFSVLAFLLALLIAILLAAPTGQGRGTSAVGQVFLGEHRFHRFSPFNFLPEIDQVKLGILLGPFLGLVQDRQESRRLAQVLLPLQRAAERRPEYREMGSVTGWTLADAWGGVSDAGHLYQYVPPHGSGEHLPALVVLHGYGGNNKAYPIVFEEFGARNRFIVLCPSFGFGTYGEGCVEAVERVRTYALEKLSADRRRIFLAGYSNGGIGVFKAVAAHPDHYAGMILICAVFRPDLVTPGVREEWGQRPILCLSGDNDLRISSEYTSGSVNRLRGYGLNVAWLPHPKEDHFLPYSSPREMVGHMTAWAEGGVTGTGDPGH